MKLNDADVLALLPVFMRDDESAAALSRAANKLIRGPGGRVAQLRVWDKIGELADADLDELAWELDIDWYGPGMDIAVKRDLVRNAAQIQAKRGTKWAVEKTISDCFGHGWTEEWFEYGGKPFHFKVYTENYNITKQDINKFLKVLNSVKRASAVLESVEYVAEAQGHCTGYAAIAGACAQMDITAEVIVYGLG